VRVLSIAGIPLRVHPSWLLIYALLTWTLAVGYFPRAVPELPTSTYWANALAAALLLFVSVLLHELSHSLVAHGRGIAVREITLHVFGGVSHLGDEPRSPRDEFLIAVVGPLTSFGLAATLLGLSAWEGIPAGPTRAIVMYLAITNAAIGVFNLIPGFPLDGGRLLRSALWRWTGDVNRATRIAARVGDVFAIGLVGLGVLEVLNGVVFGGVWLVLLGFFLRGAADDGYSQTALREALGELKVRDIMANRVVTVGQHTTVAELVERFWRHHFTSFPVVDDGRVVGVAAIHDVERVAREQWAWTRVRDVMRPLDAELVVRPDEAVVRALEKASVNRLGRLAVLDESRLVGYLSIRDIAHVLAVKGAAPELVSAARAA
jgi:Zn-dependent protease/CBS domain-containing protein